MQYSSKSCDIKVMNNQYIYVYFKSGITQEYNEMLAIYELLKRETLNLPILYDLSRIGGMDFDAMDFSLKEWDDLAHLPIAWVFSRGTISEKYAMIILNNQKPRPTLRFFDNALEAVNWLLSQETKTE